MCSVFIFLDLHYIYIFHCIFVFSKFSTWLRARGSAFCLAITPEFFLLFLRARIFICLLWLAQVNIYICMYIVCIHEWVSICGF